MCNIVVLVQFQESCKWSWQSPLNLSSRQTLHRTAAPLSLIPHPSHQAISAVQPCSAITGRRHRSHPTHPWSQLHFNCSAIWPSSTATVVIHLPNHLSSSNCAVTFHCCSLFSHALFVCQLVQHLLRECSRRAASLCLVAEHTC